MWYTTFCDFDIDIFSEKQISKIIDYINNDNDITEVIYEEGLILVPTKIFNQYYKELSEKGYEYGKALQDMYIINI